MQKDEIELKIINHYKLMIYELIDAEDLETSNSIKNELIGRSGELPEIIYKILWEFIVPYFRSIVTFVGTTNRTFFTFESR